MGRNTGHDHSELAVTEDLSRRLVRLPLWLGLEDQQDQVIDLISESLL
jgi:dTDP-4-amino-4,6-dideoxygalactose transaminase